MRLWRPNRSLSSVGENLRESLFFFRSPKLSSSYLISSPILLHSSESHRVSTFSTAEDEKYGFRRPEMYGRSLSGTVGAYERHVFLCYRSHEVWPSRVEGSDADLLPKLLSSAIKTRENEISVKTKLTICEAGEGAEHSDGDVLVFPDMLKYRGRMGRINDEEGKKVDEDKIPSAEVSKETKNKPWENDIQGNN